MRSVFNKIPGLKYSWKWLVFNAYPWVSLVILKKYIISRLIFFNQIIFEQESIKLCFDNNIANIRYFPDKNIELCIFMPFLLKIGGDPFFEILGFSYVNDFSVTVKILVDPRSVWKRL